MRSSLWQSNFALGDAQRDVQARVLPQETFVPLKALRAETNILKQCTLLLCSTYNACNPAFSYNTDKAPRRALTDPSDGVSNGGRDNKNQELIIYVNDDLGSNHSDSYQVVCLLGSGTFGQVVKAVHQPTQAAVAVKVIKNHSAYLNQAKMEIFILRSLQEKYAKDERFRIVQLFDYFMHHDHLCLVFEMLHLNLYELLRSNHYKGLSLTVIRVFLKQLLNALSILQEVHIIHCDLKPENILLCDQSSAAIKLIDFGSACFENQTVYTYIQSRYYRSPEVLCGYTYNSKIDMWSLGCILAELFLGLPLFPGVNDYNQMARIAEMCSYPPAMVLEGGKHSGKYFKRVPPGTASGPAGECPPPPGAPKEEAPSAPPKSTSRPFSLNSMLSLGGGGGTPPPKERARRKKGKEEPGESDEMGVEMTTIASYEHLDTIGDAPPPKPSEVSDSPTSPCPACGNGAAQCLCKAVEGGASPENPRPKTARPKVPEQFPVIGEWQLKTEEEFSQETGAPKAAWKRYFNYTQLEDLIMHVPYKDQGDTNPEKLDRVMFADFLRGLLLPDFRERWTAEQALEHPFVVEDGRQLFNGPGRYHADVVMVENRRVERARQLAEWQRQQQQQQQQATTPKAHTRSVPIPRQPVLAAPYPASWGSLVGNSPGYTSPPTAQSTLPLAMPRGAAVPSLRHASHMSSSPPSPYLQSAPGMPQMQGDALDELPEPSPDFALTDSFSLSGSYDPGAASGLAQHLAYAQLCGSWPPPAPRLEAAGLPGPHPPVLPGPHGPPGCPPSSGPIPVPRRSDAMAMPTMGLSFEQAHGPHLFPPSPIAHSPGSFYGAHMHPGAAAQLLGVSPTVSGSPWDPYAAPHQRPPAAMPPPPGQQRRHQKAHAMAVQQQWDRERERSLSWSAPKPSHLSQLMAAGRGGAGAGSVSSSSGGSGILGAALINPPGGARGPPVAKGGLNDPARPLQRHRSRKGPQGPGHPGWSGAPPGPRHGAHGPQSSPQDAPDAAWDPFFDDTEL